MSAEKLVIILEMILLSLAIIVVLYYLISIIRKENQLRKVFKKLDGVTIECLVNNDDKITNATTKENFENKDYNNMNVVELKKIAQKRKIKGYYNLHKEELIKALKETEISSELKMRE